MTKLQRDRCAISAVLAALYFASLVATLIPLSVAQPSDSCHSAVCDVFGMAVFCSQMLGGIGMCGLIACTWWED